MTRTLARHHCVRRRARAPLLGTCTDAPTPDPDPVAGLNELWTHKHEQWLAVVDALRSLGDGWIARLYPAGRSTRDKFAEYHALLDGFRELITAWIAYVLAARGARLGAEERVRAAHTEVVCLQRRLRTARRYRDAAVQRAAEAEQARDEARAAKAVETTVKQEAGWAADKAKLHSLQMYSDNQAGQLRTLRLQQSKDKATIDALKKELAVAESTIKAEHDHQIVTGRPSPMRKPQTPLEGYASPAVSSEYSHASGQTVSFETWRATLAERDDLAGQCERLQRHVADLQRRAKVDRPDRPDKADKTGKADKPDRSDKSDKPGEDDGRTEADVRTKYRVLKGEWHVLKEQKRSLAQQLEKARSGMAEAESALQKERDTGREAREKAMGATAKLEAMKQHIQAVEKQLSEAVEARETFKANLKLVQAEHDNAAARLRDLQVAKVEDDKTVVERVRLQNELQDQAGRLSRLKADNEAHVRTRTELEARTRSLEQATAGSAEALRQAKARTDESQQAAERLRGQLQGLERDVKDAVDGKMAVEQRVRRAQQEWDAERQELLRQIKEVRREHAAAPPLPTGTALSAEQSAQRDARLLELQALLRARDSQVSRLQEALGKNRSALSVLLEEHSASG